MWNLNRTSNDWTEAVGLTKRRPAILAGVDIGTSKTAVIIAQGRNGSPRILGAAETPSIGVAKGCISSPEAASKAVLQALEQALANAGVNRPASVFVSFNGDTTVVKDCLVNLEPGRYSDRRNKHNSFPAIPAGLAEGDSALQLIPPREFTGRSVFEVDAGARAVTAPIHNIRDISKAVHLAGFNVEAVIFGPVAASEVLLTTAEKEFGTILIDIGAGTTSVSIFDQGTLRETEVFAVGGEHLVSDLAIGLHTSLTQAVEILSSCELSDCREDKAGLAKSIIEARLTEILYLTGKAFKNFQYPGLLPGGAVFCGGVTRIEGFARLAENILQIPVRVGSIQFDGLTHSLTLANALGLVKYGAQRLTETELRLSVNYEPGALMDRVLKWLQGRKKSGSKL